jgi:hypothetical protein
MNLDAVTKLPPAVIAASHQETKPVELLGTVTRMLTQGFKGLASAGPSQGNALAEYVGKNVNALSIEVIRQKLNVQIESFEKEEVDWPLEVWTFQQMLQPFLTLSERQTLIAYTSNGIILGFGTRP